MDSTGRLIDGDSNGKPGGNVAIMLWHPGVTFSAAEFQRESKQVLTVEPPAMLHVIGLI
jgi:hypothetical protein